MVDLAADQASAMAELHRSLAVFDLADLAAGVGGLQLAPANADHILRFELLAQLVTTLDREDPGSRPQISIARLRTVLNKTPIANPYLVSAEDPYEEPFTSTAVFHGGTYVTLPGASNASTEIAQLLLRAVLHGPPGATPQFADEVARLGLAVLKLSDAMCARAGLGRYEAPVPGKGDDAVVPNAALFRPLQSAVTFSSVELDELLGADWRNTIVSLVSPVGTTLPTDNPDDSGFLARSPILEVGNSWIVIAPGLLLTALRHRILMLAGVFGELTTVATHFHQIVLIEVDKALDRMGYRRHVARGDAPATELGTDILVSFDYDKILHCIVVTDPITRIRRQLGPWGVDRSGLLRTTGKSSRLNAGSPLRDPRVHHRCLAVGRC